MIGQKNDNFVVFNQKLNLIKNLMLSEKIQQDKFQSKILSLVIYVKLNMEIYYQLMELLYNQMTLKLMNRH